MAELKGRGFKPATQKIYLTDVAGLATFGCSVLSAGRADICKVSKFMKFVIFADDTNIICSGEDSQQLLEEITHEMNKLKNWFDTNKLTLNLDKAKIMLFGRRKNNTDVKIIIDNVTISRVNQTTFLGVIIDEKICWKPHINNVCTKLAKSVGLMFRLEQWLYYQSLLILYYSFV